MAREAAIGAMAEYAFENIISLYNVIRKDFAI